VSIVSVHGPNTFGSKSISGNATGTAYAIPNAANGLIWTFSPADKSQAAANYVWTYTGLTGTPTSPINATMSPTITFSGAGTATVTLRLNSVNQAPITVNAVAGAAPRMAPEEEAEAARQLETLPGQSGVPGTDGEQDDTGEMEVAFDPAAHTVTEVIGFVEDYPDLLEDVLLAEEAGKARSTLLIQHLESMRSS
jgi:hypothetical protein